jgi:hypothetical protein
MRERQPGLLWFVTEQFEWLEDGDRLRRFERFTEANTEIGRSTLVTDRVLDNVYKPARRPASMHPEPHLTTFSERVSSIRPGTPYVLAVLRSDQEFPLNTSGLSQAWSRLAPGVMPLPLRHHYTVVVGRVGEKPVLMESRDRPYRVRLRLETHDFDIRMESWLPTDTIRRAGFGHVVVDRQHVLTLERGLSFVALGPGGGPIYGSGLFAPLARHIVASPIPNP